MPSRPPLETFTGISLTTVAAVSWLFPGHLFLFGGKREVDCRLLDQTLVRGCDHSGARDHWLFGAQIGRAGVCIKLKAGPQGSRGAGLTGWIDTKPRLVGRRRRRLAASSFTPGAAREGHVSRAFSVGAHGQVVKGLWTADTRDWAQHTKGPATLSTPLHPAPPPPSSCGFVYLLDKGHLAGGLEEGLPTGSTLVLNGNCSIC